MAGDPSNLALYRRYRPATFAEVKGQDQVTVPLRQALLAGRVHHAYLFSGPRGCGKTSSARILARSLNCEQGPTPDPCGKCESCIALAPGGPGSIDVIEIDAASHGGVDDARELRERAFYAPVSGRYKVYIIDEAHMVTREGFNALLKLVEEPPQHLKFVFATTEPEKVIGTIKSRTHHYPFRLIPPQVLRELLEQVLDAEGVRYDPGILPLVVRAGAGSARDALSVLDQLLAGSGESGISYAATVALLGYTDASLLDATVDAFAARDGAAVFHVVDQVINAGHDPRRFAADLLDRLRDLIVLGAIGDVGASSLLDVPADQLDRMRQQVAKFGTAELTRAAEVFNAGLTEMRGAASPRLLLELTCARVLLPAAEADEAALLTRLERIERRLAVSSAGGTADAAEGPRPAQNSRSAETTRPAAAPRPPAETPQPAESRQPESPAPPESPRTAESPRREAGSAPGVLDTEALRRGWPGILDAVRQVRKVSWIQLSTAAVASLDGNVLTLEFARDGDLKGFAASRSDALLAKVLHERFGVQWRIQAIAASGHGRSGSSGLVPGPAQDQVTVRVAQQAQGTGRAERDASRHPAGNFAPGDAQGTAKAAGSSAQPRPAKAAAPPRTQMTAPMAAPVPAEEPDLDAYGDMDDHVPAGASLTGMELITRELGGHIIGEIDGTEGSMGQAAP